jgi:hypothetical protein
VNGRRVAPAPQLDEELRRILARLSEDAQWHFIRKLNRWSLQLTRAGDKIPAPSTDSLPPGHPDYCVDEEVRSKVMGLTVPQRRELGFRFLRWAEQVLHNADRIERESQKQSFSVYSRN